MEQKIKKAYKKVNSEILYEFNDKNTRDFVQKRLEEEIGEGCRVECNVMNL